MEEVRGGEARITGDEAHHLTRVLRVEPGQRYEISDNQHLYLAEVQAARKAEVSFAIIEKLNPPAPSVPVDLFAALIRFERFEWIVEKATELGVRSIRPFAADRSEKGLEAAAQKRIERWRRIAREASEQSRRLLLPEISDPESDIPDASSFGQRFFLDELPDTPPLLKLLDEPGESVALCIGPEGGWTDRERARAETFGWKRASLGRRILRAETAAVASIAIVNSAWEARALR